MRVAVVAIFAAFIAAHTLSVLVGTQIKGVAGMEKTDKQTKEERWDWATQWSFPPQEILRVIMLKDVKTFLRDATQWLHLVLLYVALGLSLRSTSFFAATQGLVRLSEGAKRLRNPDQVVSRFLAPRGRSE